MTDVELTYDIPYNPPARQPKPAACESPTVASFTVRLIERDNGLADREITITRSCGHWYFSTHDPEIGSPSMVCLGPQVETQRSGRADPTLPAMKKGKGWRKLKGAA